MEKSNLPEQFAGKPEVIDVQTQLGKMVQQARVGLNAVVSKAKSGARMDDEDINYLRQHHTGLKAYWEQFNSVIDRVNTELIAAQTARQQAEAAALAAKQPEPVNQLPPVVQQQPQQQQTQQSQQPAQSDLTVTEYISLLGNLQKYEDHCSAILKDPGLKKLRFQLHVSKQIDYLFTNWLKCVMICRKRSTCQLTQSQPEMCSICVK
jgi:hypothetical protein